MRSANQVLGPEPLHYPSTRYESGWPRTPGGIFYLRRFAALANAMNRRRILGTMSLLPLAMLSPRSAWAAFPPVCSADGIAIGGADPVCYFTEGGYVPGRPEHATLWRGAFWRFSGRTTQTLFEMNPLAYCPQFGGYCTQAVAGGKLADGDPTMFLLHAGAVFFCMSRFELGRMQRDIDATIAAARRNWPAVLGG